MLCSVSSDRKRYLQTSVLVIVAALTLGGIYVFPEEELRRIGDTHQLEPKDVQKIVNQCNDFLADDTVPSKLEIFLQKQNGTSNAESAKSIHKLDNLGSLNDIAEEAILRGILQNACPLKFTPRAINENTGVSAGLLGGAALLFIFHLTTTGRF